jgi:hypothetical protein
MIIITLYYNWAVYMPAFPQHHFEDTDCVFFASLTIGIHSFLSSVYSFQQMFVAINTYNELDMALGTS